MLGTDPLLERDAERTRIAGQIARAAAGEGELLVIEGPAGIGKSRLLAFAAHAAQEHDATVLRARAGELEQSFAFGVVRQLFESLLARAPADERARLLEGAADLAAPLFDPARLTEAPGESIYPLLHGLYWFTANVARDRPLVLCVDDAQWADEPSVHFLDFLARRVADLGVAVVVATRPVEALAGPLAGLLVAASAHTLHPVELSQEATAALLEHRLGTVSDPAFAAACRTAAGGNPFLLGELVQLLAAEGVRPDAAMVERVGELGPRAIGDSVRVRVARLGAGARELIEAIAVLGDHTQLEEAAALAGVDHAQALADELRRGGVLADGPALAFAHPVLRAAVYQGIGAAEREQAHRAAAQALLAAGRPAEQVAAHLLSIPRPLGEWATAPLRDAAARALALGDLRTAERVLHRALIEEPAAIPLQAALGRVQVLSMQPAAAATLTAVLAATDDPAVAVRAANDLGLMLLFSGQIDALVDVLSETEAAIATRDPDAAALLGAGLHATTTISFAAQQRLSERIDAVHDAGRPAATVPERLALIALAQRDALAGRPVSEIGALVGRALETPGLQSDPKDVLTGRLSAMGPLLVAELYDEIEALGSAELEIARRNGSAFAAAASLGMRALGRARRGDLTGSETDAREALELIRAGGFESFSTGIAQASLLICVRETGAALGELAAVLDAPGPDPDLGPNGVLLLARAEALADRGDHEQALVSLLDAGRVYADAAPAFLAWRSAAAMILHDLGRPEEAIALVDDELARARTSQAAGALGVALRARALLAPADDAYPLLDEAVATLARSGARLEHARALVDLGALVRRAGRRTEGREHLRAGHELAVAAGATVLAKRARTELAASGMRMSAPGLSGARALTPSERRVAELAAQGMRNREIAQALFVTEKTVETHLSHCYDKLRIRSRRELTRVLAA